MSFPVLWIMGLSGSGKTALSNGILKVFPEYHYIDNDKFRGNNKDFSKSARIATVDALRELVIQEAKKYPVLVNKITPYEKEMREPNRNLIPNYHEIFCSCPLKTCMERDVKGLYKKAIEGKLDHMIGISTHPDDIYEYPKNAVIIDTTLPYEVSLHQLLEYVKKI